MGHLGEQNLQKLKTMSIRMDLPLNNCIYIPCVQKQIKKKLYKRKFKPGTYLLKFIYTDITGPFPVTGYN
jgi:hypothetical protein